MFNWSVFKNICSAAIFAGLLAGLLLTGLQAIKISPLILQAEVYEDMAAQAGHIPNEAQVEHHHYQHEWQPADGSERTLYTLLANISLAIGFALLLGTALLLYGRVNAYSGLLWGLAGYAVFFLAPALGLPPEVPGTEAAPLMDRQLWWLLTVVMTAAGLALLIFGHGWKIKIFGPIMLGIPHLVGAPHPQVAGSLAPQELADAFVHAAMFANGIFWLALGGLMGLFYKKPA